jgi:2-desacetyl-2-hydroxyethyl bacteriochlorophyllide A dehydrogenase
MMPTMKALVYEGPRELHIRSVPVPDIGDDEVLIEVTFSGICGSELGGYLGHNSLRKPPLIMGHEFSGIVARVGSNVGESFCVGQRVTVNPLISCNECESCITGKQQLCEYRVLLGAGRPGSYASFVAVPAKNVFALQDHVTLEDGALTEPLACAVRIVELANPAPDERVLIIGMGPIGLFTLVALKLLGHRNVLAIDLNEERLAIAAELGAETIHGTTEDLLGQIRKWSGSDGVQITIDAVGADVTRLQCIQFCSAGGRVIYTGLHSAATGLPINDMIRKEISIKCSFAYSHANYMQALQWITEGRMTLGKWVKKAPLEEGSSCFEKLLGNPGSIAKYLLIP